MYNRFFSFAFLFFVSTICFGQNLVPNPSFEEYENGCPSNLNEMPVGWSWWRNSPNSFNTCVTPENLTDSLGWAPWNGFGFQEPVSGESYIGLYSFGPSPKPGQDPSYREFLGCELVEPLIIGTTYFVSFKTSLALSGSYYYMTWACNRIGVIFTDQSYDWEENPMPVPNFAQVYSEEIISDTVNWVTVSGSFVADQAYTHMGLGVFFNFDQLETLEMIPGLSLGSYYYIDDVCVSSDPNCTINPGIHAADGEDDNIILFPNPANNSAFSVTNGKAIEIHIYDLNGILVYEKNVSQLNSVEIDLTPLANGIYVFDFISNKKMQREKLVIVHD